MKARVTQAFETAHADANETPGDRLERQYFYDWAEMQELCEEAKTLCEQIARTPASRAREERALKVLSATAHARVARRTMKRYLLLRRYLSTDYATATERGENTPRGSK